MNRARNVLVPIDFSKASERVVKYVLSAHEFSYDRLLLLHTYRLISDDFSAFHDSPTDLRLKIETKLLKRYREFNANFQTGIAMPESQFIMKVGFTVNCIRSICQESKIDLILYTLKKHKTNEVLMDLLNMGCSSIQLISENIDSTQKMLNNDVSKDNFLKTWEEYIRQMEENPKLSFTIVPN